MTKEVILSIETLLCQFNHCEFYSYRNSLENEFIRMLKPTTRALYQIDAKMILNKDSLHALKVVQNVDLDL